MFNKVLLLKKLDRSSIIDKTKQVVELLNIFFPLLLVVIEDKGL